MSWNIRVKAKNKVRFSWRWLCIIFIVALSMTILPLWLWHNHLGGQIYLHGAIQTPYERDHVSGEVLFVYGLRNPDEIACAKELRAWLIENPSEYRPVFQRKLTSKGFYLERSIKLENDFYQCRVSRGAKLLVLGCKGYGWIEVVTAEKDVRVDLDQSNVAWMY